MQLTKQVFWDTELSQIDLEKHSIFVIERYVSYGTYKNWKEILAFYGEERVKKDILEASWLDKKTLNFCCVYLNLNKEDFKCYTKKQLNPTHWDY